MHKHKKKHNQIIKIHFSFFLSLTTNSSNMYDKKPLAIMKNNINKMIRGRLYTQPNAGRIVSKSIILAQINALIKRLKGGDK